ncbi:MAG: FAD-binding oxidoreductase [Synechocystis sp.]|nr:FAD-binding oxidoreductase [Synechocystis sp.]
MQTYDAIVVGAGITGAAIAYELQNQGQRVLLLERFSQPINASSLSYGGIIYWAGLTPLQQHLCHESRYHWSHLSQALGGETEYRELELLLYLRPEDNYQAIKKQLRACVIPPQYVDPLTAIAIEPQLNPDAIQGAFVVPQGHAHAGKTVKAYLDAFQRRGGEIRIATVEQFLEANATIIGVKTERENLHAHRVIVATGGHSRSLLAPYQVSLPLYFTHALLLQTPYTAENLRCVVMPADLQQRPNLEALALQADWHHPQGQCLATVLEAGAVQFLDGHVFMGQISQLATAPDYRPDLALAKQQLQTAIAPILPNLATLPSTCHHCLVAFTHNPLPLLGEVPGLPGLNLFTGFTHPLVYGPPLAHRFARWLMGNEDPMITAIAQSLETLEPKE